MIYVKLFDTNYYQIIFDEPGSVSSILNSAITFIDSVKSDDRYEEFYVLIVPTDFKLDQTIGSLSLIKILEPVMTIKSNKTIQEYQDELEGLEELKSVEDITTEINNTIIDYKNIVTNYNSKFIPSKETHSNSQILDCIEKFLIVIKQYDFNPYRILNYIDDQYYDGKISDDVVGMIYQRTGYTLKDFTSICLKYDLSFDIIKKLLTCNVIDGSIETKKKIILKTIQRIK